MWSSKQAKTSYSSARSMDVLCSAPLSVVAPERQVIGEHHTLTDKHLVLAATYLADEAVRGDLALRPDDRVGPPQKRRVVRNDDSS
jgi:hypothetical protein